MPIKRRVVLVIDDDEDNRTWAQQAYLQQRPVLTVPVEGGWDTIMRVAEHLGVVLINIGSYQRGLALAILSVKAGSYHVGVTAEDIPDILQRSSFVISGALVTLNRADTYLLPDGRKDWETFLRNLTTKGAFGGH